MSWAEAAYVVSQLKSIAEEAGGGGGKPGQPVNRTLVKSGVEAANSFPPQSGQVTPGITEIDCKAIEGYGSLLLDNFAFIPTRISGRAFDGSSGNNWHNGRVITPRAEYNPATGILRLYDYSYGAQHFYGDYWHQSIDVKITYDVYCFK